jgi:hypothetical protein
MGVCVGGGARVGGLAMCVSDDECGVLFMNESHARKCSKTQALVSDSMV